jgi:molybdate transport system permease protein
MGHVDLQALGLTLRLALSTTVLLLGVALPVAWWISMGRGGLRSMAQALIALPLVLPPTVLGFYLLVSMGPLTAPGRALTRLMGHPLAFSFEGLLVGSMLYSLPFAVQPMVSGFTAVEREYTEASAMLGASPWRTFWAVTLPLSRGSILTAAVLTFTHTVGEFGVVLMLGGNIPGSTRTLSISLYDLVQDGRYREANRTSLLLLLISFCALLAIYLRRRGREIA